MTHRAVKSRPYYSLAFEYRHVGRAAPANGAECAVDVTILCQPVTDSIASVGSSAAVMAMLAETRASRMSSDLEYLCRD